MVGTSHRRGDPNVAVLLSWFLPGSGHFYLGRWVEATIDLVLFCSTIYFFVTGQILLAFVVGAIDALHTFVVTIMLLTGSFRDGQGRLVLYPGQKLTTGESL